VYIKLKTELHAGFKVVTAPPDILDRALQLQRDLAHHHGMWHRTPIPDLLIAETAIHHQLGVVHVDGDFDRRGGGGTVGDRSYGERDSKGVRSVLPAGRCCGAEWCDASAAVVLAIVSVHRGTAARS